MTPEEVKSVNKSEFLQELVKNYAKWIERGETEYASAYELLIHSFTLKKQDEQ